MTITETIKKPEMRLKKKNKIAYLIHKIREINLLPLLLTNLYNAIVATFYVYVAATFFINISPLALTLSILIGAANLIMALIVSYNTLAEKNLENLHKNDLKKQDRNIKILLIFAIPAFALNFVANLIGPYISLPLIGGALSMPVSSPLFIGICIFIGAFTAIAFGLYNIVQIYEVCQRIKPSLYDKKKGGDIDLNYYTAAPKEIKTSALSSHQIRPNTSRKPARAMQPALQQDKKRTQILAPSTS